MPNIVCDIQCISHAMGSMVIDKHKKWIKLCFKRLQDSMFHIKLARLKAAPRNAESKVCTHTACSEDENKARKAGAQGIYSLLPAK